jgi:hypothetical protein
MSELERVIQALLRSMRARSVLPLQSYQVEVDILAIAARNRHKPNEEITATNCVIGPNKPTKQEP